MASDKIPVIERIWAKLQSEGEGRMVVYFEDVTEAIEYCNQQDGLKRSGKNPANFMKDLVRSDNASGNWPRSLCQAGIGGRQRVGHNRVFEFAPYEEGQQEPFPNRYYPKPDLAPFPLQSVSLPLASKALGRRDESWLIQVAVALGVLEQHFATHSALHVRELVHLQTGVKLANSEIDGLFRGIVEDDSGRRSHVLVTCEAKQQRERILVHQIVEQIVAANKSVRASVPEDELDVGMIIPVAIKAIPPNGDVYVVEFKPWTRAEAEAAEADMKELEMASEALYRLVPPVPGIGFTSNKPKTRNKKTLAAANSANDQL